MKRDVSEFDVKASEVRASRELFQRLIEDRSWRNSWHRRKVIWAIGVQVKALRTQRQITQEQLATKAGLDKMTIVRIERPDYRNPPRMNTILQIAAAFDCAFIGKFVPWSRWLRWIIGLETRPFTVICFADDEAMLRRWARPEQPALGKGTGSD